MIDMMADIPEVRRRITVGMGDADSRLDKPPATGRRIGCIKQRRIVIRSGIVPYQMAVVSGVFQFPAQIEIVQILFFVNLQDKYIVSRLQGDDDLCSSGKARAKKNNKKMIPAGKGTKKQSIQNLMTKINRINGCIPLLTWI